MSISATSTGELEQLRETARDVFAAATASGIAPPALGDLGWLGLLVPEAHGGIGWRPDAAAVIAEESGRAGDPSPWLVAALGAAVVSAGDRAVDPAWAEGAVRGGLLAVYCLGDAASAGVAFADLATLLVVDDRSGTARLVEAGAPAVSITGPAETLDTQRPRAVVTYGGAPTIMVPVPPTLPDVARLLTSADALGAFSSARHRLVDHLRDREAFGAPVASFQAIQHRLVDLFLVETRMRALVGAAAAELTVAAPTAVRSACIAHAYVAANVQAAIDECVQLSGGIGFTWEYPLHHELRRATADASWFGTARGSRRDLARIAQW
jgi:alkylation response protein AidB-like acyl-CoA dehydrogenase